MTEYLMLNLDQALVDLLESFQAPLLALLVHKDPTIRTLLRQVKQCLPQRCQEVAIDNS